MRRRLGVIYALVATLGGCAQTPPVADASSHFGQFQDAPTPSGRYVVVRRDGPGSLAIPLQRSPSNTQAQYVSPSPVRGAIVSGLKEAF